MANALKLKMEQMGVPIEANAAFEGGAANVTPIIGKLRIQVGDYIDKEEFLIAPTSPGYTSWHALAFPGASHAKFSGRDTYFYFQE